jgi:DNA modification methylase
LIYNGDAMDLLRALPKTVPLIFADPPDNLGLAYDQYKDKRADYYDWLELLIWKALSKTRTFWLSYYWEHDLEIKRRVWSIIQRTSWQVKTLIWRYTFGQYNDNDFGSGFRYLLRFTLPTATMNADDVRIESERQRMGDKRAAGPRVPDDVWDMDIIQDIPRVTGNSAERRKWHPTQHPVELYERILKFSSRPGNLVVDLFGGTGTMVRAAEKLGRIPLISEISEKYCENIGGNIKTNMGEINNWMLTLPAPAYL